MQEFQQKKKKKRNTSEGLEAMEIESVRLEKLDAGATSGGRELLRNRMHRMPQTRQSQAIIRVHSTR